MKLISMTDFVLEQAKENGIDSHETALNSYNYANFLKQPLELWMFVPCDEDGNVLAEPPKNVDINNVDWQIEYQQAKERCLFEGVELDFKTSHIICLSNKVHNIRFYKNGWMTIDAKDIDTIEDLIKYNLQLTQTSQKQIEL